MITNIKEKELDHSKLIKIGARWLRGHSSNRCPNCSFILTELVTAARETPDIIGWNSCRSVLIEVKISRSDFLNDNKKFVRKYPEQGLGQLRYYLCPEDLINENELPEYWGLLYYKKDFKGKIKIIKDAQKYQDANIADERIMLLSYIRRNILHKKIIGGFL